MPAPSQELLADLRMDEGLRLDAYPDPLTGGAPWTIGYGHTGPEVAKGLIWTKEEAEAALLADATIALTGLTSLGIRIWAPQPVRRDALVNMVFNLGLTRFAAFHKLIAAVRVGDFSRAAFEASESAWDKQVGARAERIEHMLRTGERPA